MANCDLHYIKAFQAYVYGELIRIENDTIKLCICVRIEKQAVEGSSNFQYQIIIEDLATRAMVLGSISEFSEMVTKLIDAGVTDLTRVMMQKHLRTLVLFAVDDAKTEKTHSTYSHSILGWNRINGEDIWFGNNSIYPNYKKGRKSVIESRYDDHDKIKMSRTGDPEVWLDCFTKLVAPKPVATIVMIASLAGIVRQRYKRLSNDTQILIALVGKSSIGKTTIIKAALTEYTSGENYLGYSSTLSARIKRLAQRSPVVASIDDVLQMDELIKKKPENIRQLIFSLSSGKDKDRYGELRKTESFDNTILLSSVEGILENTDRIDLGQYSRLIEFKLKDDDIADNSYDIKELDTVFEENHGWIADQFVEKMIAFEWMHGSQYSYESDLVERYKQICDELCSITGSAFSIKNRLANRPALIVLIAEMFNDYFREYNSEKNIIDIERIKEILSEAVTRSYQSVIKYADSVNASKMITDPDEGIEKLAAYFNKYIDFFVENEKGFDAEDQLDQMLGYYSKDSAGNVDLWIPDGQFNGAAHNRLPFMVYGVEPKEILDKYDNSMKTPNEFSVNTLLKEWRDKSILLTKGSGYKENGYYIPGDEKAHPVYHVVIPGKFLSSPEE